MENEVQERVKSGIDKGISDITANLEILTSVVEHLESSLSSILVPEEAIQPYVTESIE